MDFLLTSKSYDNDGDGNPDFIITHTYDSAGNLTSESEDYDGDGSPERITTHTYDSAGNLTSESYDYDGDGSPDGITTYTYDEDGNLTSKSYDNDGDGNPDGISIPTYDEDGNLTSWSHDYDDDGNPDAITTYTYDSAGNETSESHDYDLDGSPEEIITHTYDSAGNLTSQSRDYFTDPDSYFDGISTYTYDSAGNLTSESHDYDPGGNPDSITTYTYDEASNLTIRISDDYLDGSVDSITTYTYDSAGNLTSRSYDYGLDGNPDKITTTTYIYDEDGNLIRESSDYKNDGNPDFTITYTYQRLDNSEKNDAPEYKGSSLFGAVRGESIAITSRELQTQDANHTAAELEYRLTQLPTDGDLLLEDTVLEADSIFTQADINSGKLSYKHQGGAETDSFSFIVRDAQKAETPTITTKIAISNQSIIGSPTDDLLDGSPESDIIEGNDGNDVLNGYKGNDLIFGRDGDDTLTGGEGFDRLDGGAGNDLLDGGSGISVLDGGSGQDIFVVKSENTDWIKDFEVGQDRISLSDGMSYESLEITGEVNSFISYQDTQVAVLLGVEPQELSVDSFNSIPEYKGSSLFGAVRGESVTITSRELQIQDANHTADELEYRFTQLPTDGDLLLEDTVLEADSIFTQADINSGKLSYKHQGGAETDSFSFIVRDAQKAETPTITTKIAISNQSIIGSPTDDLLDGSPESDIIEGNDGNDVLNGYKGNDLIFGRDGDDTLTGGEGFDRLDGGAGNDLLDGGSGISVLDGGSGQDIFVVKSENTDWIKDFEVGQDRISLSDGMSYESLEITGEVNSFISYQDTQVAVLLGVSPDELSVDSFSSGE